MVMIRRTFIAACATAALATAAGTAVAAPKEVKMGYALAVNSHYGAAAKAWTESVDKATGGAIAIKQFPSSAQGVERELFYVLQMGTVEAAIVSTGALSNFVGDVGIVDIPFLFRDLGHARNVLDGKFGTDLLAKFQLPKELDIGTFVTKSVQTRPHIRDTFTVITFSPFRPGGASV